jgi:hypothetical protein
MIRFEGAVSTPSLTIQLHDPFQVSGGAWISHHLAEPTTVGKDPGLGLVQHEVRDEAGVVDRLGQR